MGILINWIFPVKVMPAAHARSWCVVCRVPGSDLVEASANLALACEFFFGLARRGAFCATHAVPGELEEVTTDSSSSVEIGYEEVRCEGECGAFDPRGLGMLANLVERLLPETSSLSITLPFAVGVNSIAPGCYPPRLDDLAFHVEDNSKDRNLEVQVAFARPVDRDARARIEDQLSDWWCTAALGAFRDADQAVLDSSVVPPEFIDWEDDTMNFTVEKVQTSQAFVDVLIGMIAWVDRHIAKVERLDIA